MAIEQINHYGKYLTFTDRDGSGFTAQVTLDMPELVAILNAIDDERYDEVIALAEKHRAEKAVSHLRPACPFCHDRAEHDPEWQAICDEGMREEKARQDRKAVQASVDSFFSVEGIEAARQERKELGKLAGSTAPLSTAQRLRLRELREQLDGAQQEQPGTSLSILAALAAAGLPEEAEAAANLLDRAAEHLVADHGLTDADFPAEYTAAAQAVELLDALRQELYPDPLVWTPAPQWAKDAKAADATGS